MTLGALAVAACTDSTGAAPSAAPEFPLSVNIFIFSGYAVPREEFGRVPGIQCPWPSAWGAMKKQDRIPAIGEYNEADQAISDYYLALLEYAGIDSAVYQIEVDHAAVMAGRVVA